MEVLRSPKRGKRKKARKRNREERNEQGRRKTGLTFPGSDTSEVFWPSEQGDDKFTPQQPTDL